MFFSFKYISPLLASHSVIEIDQPSATVSENDDEQEVGEESDSELEVEVDGPEANDSFHLPPELALEEENSEEVRAEEEAARVLEVAEQLERDEAIAHALSRGGRLLPPRSGIDRSKKFAK